MANITICPAHPANYLSGQQIRKLAEAFIREGGLREHMTRALLDSRNRAKLRTRRDFAAESAAAP